MFSRTLTASILGPCFLLASGCSSAPEAPVVPSDPPAEQPAWGPTGGNGYEPADFVAQMYSLLNEVVFTTLTDNNPALSTYVTPDGGSSGEHSLKELVRCALPKGTTLVLSDANDQTHSFSGEFGLAPGWARPRSAFNHHPDLQPGDTAWVSACMVALLNGVHAHVPIMMMGNNPALEGVLATPDTERYDVDDISVMGDFLYEGEGHKSDHVLVCRERGAAAACSSVSSSDWLLSRICGLSTPSCGVTVIGDCDAYCTGEPGARTCSYNGVTYTEVVSIKLPRTSASVMYPPDQCDLSIVDRTFDGRCASGTVAEIFTPTMVGCAGAFPYDRVTNSDLNVCGGGWVPCDAQTWLGTRPADHAPAFNYWTSTALEYDWDPTDSQWAGPNHCSVSDPLNPPSDPVQHYSCGDEPMRICTPEGDDGFGNQCNWMGCGYRGGEANPYDNAYFGGCVGDHTAGVLCCPANTCAGDGDCGLGMLCDSGNTNTCQPGCRLSGGNGCRGNYVCNATTDASPGACVLNCAADSECAPGLICDTGTSSCQPGCRWDAWTCPGFQYCTATSDAPVGVCALWCWSDADCAGQVCNTTTNTCFAP